MHIYSDSCSDPKNGAAGLQEDAIAILSVRGRGAPQAGMMREIRARWGPHRTSAARYPLDERGFGMHFLSRYSSFATQLLDGHPLDMDSPGFSHNRRGQYGQIK